MGADFRQITVISQDIYREGGRALATPCRRVAACGVLHNPHTNGPAIDDVSALVELSFQAGEMDTMTVAIPDAPRPDEILLAVAFLGGARPNARIKGASQAQVEELVRRMRDGR